jgi:hypothetical protein
MAAEGFTKIESLKEQTSKEGGDYQRWISELQAADKESDKWRKKGRKIVKEYRAERSEASGLDVSMERRFNLFAANVNILQTSLMNQAPSATVNREFKDASDDVARIACNILERALNSHNNRNFKIVNILKQVVQDMLVPGLGLSWHTYYAETEAKTQEPTEAMLQANPEAKGLEYDEVVKEEIRDEYVYWEDLAWSPARTWEEVRWIARKTYLTKDQGTKRFGKAFKDVPLDYAPKKQDSSVETKNAVFQQAIVFEIWDRDSKKVIWLNKNHDKILEEKDDFLELDGFFPCPKPLVSTMSNGQFVPIPDFEYAKDQYRELNEVNTRIGLLVRACRVAGVYDKSAPQVATLLNNAAENTLVAVDQWAAFAEKGGIKGVIDWIPLEQIVATIDQLLKAREDIKQQIYEITGMADIIRGATKASETLGAQKIKAQYASMRIQERQKAVVEFSSSIFDIQAQLMRKHMDISEIAKLAQVDFMAEDPQAIQQALKLIKMPEFVLRSQVESDTLSDIDFQAEKSDRMEYMQTISNYLKDMLPHIQNDPMMGPFLLQLLQFSLAGFKIGKKFEGELDKTFQAIQQKIANPPPPEKTPEEKKVEGELQIMQAEGEERKEEHGLKMEEMKMGMQTKAQENKLKLVGKQDELRVKQQANAQKMEQNTAQFWQRMQQDAQRAQQEQANAFMTGGGGGNA